MKTVLAFHFAPAGNLVAYFLSRVSTAEGAAKCKGTARTTSLR